MDNQRLTLFDPTNITVPIAVFNTLVHDAFHFEYIKNEMANLSGLLNHLIPAMTMYRENLHQDFLKQNNGDEKLTRKIEESIYKTYFNQYDFCDDGTCVIPFRVNKSHYDDFIKIHDLLLQKYNMDFSSFVRSLLLEYCSKRLCQREYFFHYKLMDSLKFAIRNQFACYFYDKKERVTFVPLSLETSKNNGSTYIVGITKDKEKYFIYTLSLLKKLTVEESFSYNISNDDYNCVLRRFEEFENGEDERCSD